MAGFTPLLCNHEREKWVNESPYAALLFISCTGKVSHSRLTSFLGRYILHDVSRGRRFLDDVAQALLQGGHIYEVTGGHYRALPPYAVQRDSEEWAVLGDARVDRLLAKESPVFEVRSHISLKGLWLERVLLAPPYDASRLFEAAGLRSFPRRDLLNLIPDIESLTVPVPWPGFEPSPYPNWEFLNERGRWIVAQSQSSIPRGVCRGSTHQEEDGRAWARYFFRHENGWSPLTQDEARLWALREAVSRRDPYSARFAKATRALRLPRDIPQPAYVALRHMGHQCVVADDELIVEEIDFEVAMTLCQKLGIELFQEEGRWRG